MLTTYHTLRALVACWTERVEGGTVLDAFTQNPDELLVAIDPDARSADDQSPPSAPSTIHVSVEAQFPYLFRSEGYHRARANAVTLLGESVDRRVVRFRIADRDRIIYLDMEEEPDGEGFAGEDPDAADRAGTRGEGDGDRLQLQIQLFGTKANVFLVRGDTIVDAFKDAEQHRGDAPPEPRTAPRVGTWESFRDRWQADRNDLKQAISFTDLTLDRTLGAEVLFRSGLEEKRPDRVTDEEKRLLFEAYVEVLEELRRPEPRIYWDGPWPAVFSLIELRHLAGWESGESGGSSVRSVEEGDAKAGDRPREDGEAGGRRIERFDDLDRAVRLFTTRRLARRHFEEVYRPLHSELEQVRDRLRRSLDRMEKELSSASEADRYERWGHLLMSEGSSEEKGREEVRVTDLFAEDQETITIPLDPARTVVENAEAYYERARRARASRREARERWEETEARFERCDRLLEELDAVENRSELEEFERSHEEELAAVLGSEDREGERVPFRQFRVHGDYEVWAGKNARQNDELLSRHARKHDYWMHARNVPGSHVLLRRQDRDQEPPKRALHEAAAVAAYYSQARGSSLVPVQVTQRKYVHKPKGAPPGRVRVDREEVLMVEPGLPKNR